MPDSFNPNHMERAPANWNDAFAALPLESAPSDRWSRVVRALDLVSPHARATLRERRINAVIGVASAAVLAMVVWAPLSRHQWAPEQVPPAVSNAVASRADADTTHRNTRTAPAMAGSTQTMAANETAEIADAARLPADEVIVKSVSRHHRAHRPSGTRVAAAHADRPLQSAAAGSLPVATTSTASATESLSQLQAQSAQLEALVALARDDRVSSALSLALTSELDDRISLIDAALSQADLPVTQRTALWQQRVDALRELAGVESTERWLAARGEHLDGTLVTVD
jgi:hypothetical protein